VAKVVLLTTVYNRARYLEETINSVLAQTYPDFSYLVWDDGSTDGSLRIAHEYAAFDPRIVVVGAAHRGVAGAAAAAYSHAQLMGAEFVGQVDSDDWLGSCALRETVQRLHDDPGVGLCYTHHNLIDSDGNPLGESIDCKAPYTPLRLLTGFMCRHFRLIRMTAYVAAGGINPTLPAAIDYDLCLRLSEVTKFCCLPEVHYSYRLHDDRVTVQLRDAQIATARASQAEARKRRLL
jgi:glycosyltransferase involved in cell wall biosynthesis